MQFFVKSNNVICVTPKVVARGYETNNVREN